MVGDSVSQLSAVVHALRLVACPTASDSRKDLAKQELLRRVELLLLLRQQQQCQEWRLQQQLQPVQFPPQQEHQNLDWECQWEEEATTEAEVLLQLEEALIQLCCQQPPAALQQQLLRLLLLRVSLSGDPGVWLRVAARLLLAASEGLSLPPPILAFLWTAAAAPGAASAEKAEAISPFPPLLLCAELMNAGPHVLSPLLPALAACGAKLVQSPATPEATTVAAVAKALRTAVAAIGVCGERLSGKLLKVALACLRWSTTKSVSQASCSHSKSSLSSNAGSETAGEAAKEALLMLQQVVWVSPRSVTQPLWNSLFDAVLAAAVPEPLAAAREAAALESAQENVPHAAAALAVLLAAKSVTGAKQHRGHHKSKHSQQQHRAATQFQEACEATAETRSFEKKANDMAAPPADSWFTDANRAGGFGADPVRRSLLSEVATPQDAFLFLRRHWLLQHATIADPKKSYAGCAVPEFFPVFLPATTHLQHGQEFPLKMRQRGVLRQIFASAVVCLCRLLMGCQPPFTLVFSAFRCLLTLLTQVAAAESRCSSCSSGDKRGRAGNSLQPPRLRSCKCCCNCGSDRCLTPCVSLETLHSRALASHAAQQLVALLQPQHLLHMMQHLSRPIAAAAGGGATEERLAARGNAMQQLSRADGSATSTSSCSPADNGDTHTLVLLAALDILESLIMAAGDSITPAVSSVLQNALVSVLTAASTPSQPLHPQAQCVMWPAVQRQAAACVWRLSLIMPSPATLHSLRLNLMQAAVSASAPATAAAATAAVAAAVDTSNAVETNARQKLKPYFGPWGPCIGLAASIAGAPSVLQHAASAAAGSKAARTPAEVSATTPPEETSEERGLEEITDLCCRLARGETSVERACLFVLVEAVLQQPAANAMGDVSAEKPRLLSPAVSLFLRASRQALSLTDPSSSINRLFCAVDAAETAASTPLEGSGLEAAKDAQGAAAAATVSSFLLELSCAFRASAAFLRQQPVGAETVVADGEDSASSRIVPLVLEAALALCVCSCSKSSTRGTQISLSPLKAVSREGAAKTQKQALCLRCCCVHAFRNATAHVALEAAALESLSFVPDINIHCTEEQQRLMLQLALSATTVSNEEASQFPIAAVACCICPNAGAAAAALRVAPLEQLQQQQLLIEQLVQQQQLQRGSADPSLFIGCDTAADSLSGPSFWESVWRCVVDTAAASCNALRLDTAQAGGVSTASPLESGWRSCYPPFVLRVLQGARLLRHLTHTFCGVDDSPPAIAALEQTAWAACCSWSRQLPRNAALADAAAHRRGRASKRGVAAAGIASQGICKGLKASSKQQQLLQRFVLPRLKRKSSAAAAASSSAATDDPADDAAVHQICQQSCIAAVLSDIFNSRVAFLSTHNTHQPRREPLPLPVVDSLWCCCEKALAAASPFERLLFADAAGALFSLLKHAAPVQRREHQQDQLQQENEEEETTRLHAIQRHVRAFFLSVSPARLPRDAEGASRSSDATLLNPAQLCSLSLVATSLLPLVQPCVCLDRAAKETGFDSTSSCRGDILQFALTATSAIESAEDYLATFAPPHPTAAASVPFGCALLCVIRFLGASLPVVAALESAPGSKVKTEEEEGAPSSDLSASSLSPSDNQEEQLPLQQQQSVLQQQLFRAMQFSLLLRASQSLLTPATVLIADAARRLLLSLMEQANAAAAAAAKEPAALTAAIEGPIAHAAVEAAYLVSVCMQAGANCSSGSSSSSSSMAVLLQLVSALPAMRCVAALLRIHESSLTASSRSSDILAAASLSLRAVIPAVVAAVEAAIACPSLAVRREAVRCLQSLSTPLDKTEWGSVVAASVAAAAADSEVVAGATAPVPGDPQVALFLFEALNSERDSLQQQQLKMLLLQHVKLWGVPNVLQWVSLLTCICCNGVAASPALRGCLSTLTPNGSSHSSSIPPRLLPRAQQLLPQTKDALLSPLAVPRLVPPLMGFFWRPLPSISAAPPSTSTAAAADGDVLEEGETWLPEDGGADPEVRSVVCATAAECLEALLTLPGVQPPRCNRHASAAVRETAVQHADEIDASLCAGVQTPESCIADCLPALVRTGCELMLRGVRQQQQQPSKQTAESGATLAFWGLRLVLLLLQRFASTAQSPAMFRDTPIPVLQQYEVAISSTVASLLRCFSPLEPSILAATEGKEAAAACYSPRHQQDRMIAMGVEVLWRLAAMGCCLSPWRLVGLLLLPLGDEAQSAAAVVTAATAKRPPEWLLERRLALACRLLCSVVATPTACPTSVQAARPMPVFAEQRDQWLSAFDSRAVALTLRLMGTLLQKSSHHAEQQKQQESEDAFSRVDLLRCLAVLCEPLLPENTAPPPVASALAALAVSEMNSLAACVTKGDHVSLATPLTPAASTNLAPVTAIRSNASLLDCITEALLLPLESAAASAVSTANTSAERKDDAAAPNSRQAPTEELCLALEVSSRLLGVQFPVSRQQSGEEPKDAHQNLLTGSGDPGDAEEDWEGDWLAADSGVDFVAASVPAGDVFASSCLEPAATETLCLLSLNPSTLRRGCASAQKLAVAAAAAFRVARQADGRNGGVAVPLWQQEKFGAGVEKPKDTASAAATAGKVLSSCLCFMWRLAAALQSHPEALAGDDAAAAFFGAAREVSRAALSVCGDVAGEAWRAVALGGKAAQRDMNPPPPSGMCEAALALLQRCFCVVPRFPVACAAASAVSMLLTDLETALFPACLCEGPVSGLSPVDAVKLLRSLYDSAAQAAAATAAVTIGEHCCPQDDSAPFLNHCASTLEIAVSCFVGDLAAPAGSEPTVEAKGRRLAVASVRAREARGVLALAAALVALESLAATGCPWLNNSRQQQQQQKPAWCERIRSALERLSEFAYSLEADSRVFAFQSFVSTATRDSERAASTPACNQKRAEAALEPRATLSVKEPTEGKGLHAKPTEKPTDAPLAAGRNDAPGAVCPSRQTAAPFGDAGGFFTASATDEDGYRHYVIANVASYDCTGKTAYDVVAANLLYVAVSRHPAVCARAIEAAAALPFEEQPLWVDSLSNEPAQDGDAAHAAAATRTQHVKSAVACLLQQQAKRQEGTEH
ncbi:uncharacterized protein LOC34621288 [Cyclospora cayetanensis]|uniref:Uncharacterized protein LOC34621288 n=1 Tax=Cyclospora cayetanensis TaxID=88456 RepID=A0A6P6S293_9EIME|nr:uncharacterized protein LOC34621288 [Cyclospora cayetanensis]